MEHVWRAGRPRTLESVAQHNATDNALQSPTEQKQAHAWMGIGVTSRSTSPPLSPRREPRRGRLLKAIEIFSSTSSAYLRPPLASQCATLRSSQLSVLAPSLSVPCSIEDPPTSLRYSIPSGTARKRRRMCCASGMLCSRGRRDMTVRRCLLLCTTCGRRGEVRIRKRREGEEKEEEGGREGHLFEGFEEERTRLLLAGGQLHQNGVHHPVVHRRRLGSEQSTQQRVEVCAQTLRTAAHSRPVNQQLPDHATHLDSHLRPLSGPIPRYFASVGEAQGGENQSGEVVQRLEVADPAHAGEDRAAEVDAHRSRQLEGAAQDGEELPRHQEAAAEHTEGVLRTHNRQISAYTPMYQ